MLSSPLSFLNDCRQVEWRSLAISLAASLLSLVLFIRFLLGQRQKLDLPVLGKPGTKNFLNDIFEGVSKYPDTPFIIPVSPPIVILPISILNEVSSLPESQISFREDLGRMFASKHTGIGEERNESHLAIKIDLMRNMSSAVASLQDEVRYALNRKLGACETWTPVLLHKSMAHVVALLSGRVFVGLPLSRNEEWVESTVRFTVECLNSAEAMMKYPSWLIPIVTPFLPEIKKVKQHSARGRGLLGPILKATLARSRNEKSERDILDEGQGTFISWILKHSGSDLLNDSRRLVDKMVANQMVVSFAAINTTTMVVTQAIFDLVSRREYIQPLQEEIQKVLDEDGHDTDSEGYPRMKFPSIAKLRKLDSFLKESQRLSPPDFIANVHVTTAPLRLSTGHILPKGTRCGFASHAIHTSPSTLTFSPAYNPPDAKPPSEFDGFRFSKLRAQPGKDNKHQFVTSSADSLAWGHGNHACPGRFFASNEVKVIFIELLRSWEFRLKGDEKLVGGVELRPKSHEDAIGLYPNLHAEIEFRRQVG